MERKKLLEAEWSSKNDKTFSSYTKGSNYKAFWEHIGKCCEKRHEWQDSINHRYGGGRNCPYCSNQRMCVCKSLAENRPDLIKEWHPIKNKISPEKISQFSSKKVWWKCLKNPCVHHEWEVSVSNRTRGGNRCPYCSNQKICICNSIVTTHPYLLEEWHPTKNSIDPINVSFGSGKKIWWKCREADCDHHEWQTTICHRVGNKRGCPFCCSRKICPCNNLQAKFPKIASEWNAEKNKFSADQIAPFSNKKVWWKCKNKNHEWETPICDRTSGKNNCPICKENKGEKHVREILTRMCFKFVSQKRISYKECKKLSFDFFLPEHKLAIEFDGLQHFEPVEFFGGEEKFKIQQRNDLYKNMFCEENGWSLLRIHYKDAGEAEELISFACAGPLRMLLLSTNYP